MVSRRSVFGFGLAGVAVLAPAACSTDEPTGPASPTGAAEPGAFPVTVRTAFGPVRLTQPPRRVVALGWGDAETALALDVRPIGASDWLAFGGAGVGPWATGRYRHRPTLIGTLEPEREKIAALQPDLILDTKSSGAAKRHRLLTQIAPTVGMPPGAAQYATSWQEQLRMVGAAVGRPAAARRLAAKTTRKLAAAAKVHPRFRGKSIVVAAKDSTGYGAYVRGGARIDFVEALGFHNAPAIQSRAGQGFSVPVSRERLDLLDADLTVVLPIGVSADSIRTDRLFRAIPSVRAGRSVVLDDKTISAAFSDGTVLAVDYAIRTVVPVLAAALRA